MSQMGNCFIRCNKDSTLDEISTVPSADQSSTDHATSIQKKKVVRFDVGAGAGAGADHDQNGSGDEKEDGKVVRLRIMVSTRELNQILNMEKDDQICLDSLLEAVRMSGREITQVEDGSSNDVERRWKPGLESIPEEY
ncbi:hypothetical protein ACLOJK_039446 [Asimina triloba]